MATKAELLDECMRHDATMAQARAAESQGLYSRAVQLAVSAWPFIDGMMQYRRRFEEVEFNSVASVDLPLRYAPLLFDFQCLERLVVLLKQEKRIERNTAADLGEKLTKARERLWLNHQLFSYLENNPGVRQDSLRSTIGGDQEYWRNTCEAWQVIGLLQREPEGGSYRLTLVTRLGQLVWAKCSRCGASLQAPKAMFLEVATCGECHHLAGFVMLAGKP